jgi:hypothetical protein
MIGKRLKLLPHFQVRKFMFGGRYGVYDRIAKEILRIFLQHKESTVSGQLILGNKMGNIREFGRITRESDRMEDELIPPEIKSEVASVLKQWPK